MNSFEELEVWKSARMLRIEISKMVKDFPIEEKFKLTDQLLRCSRSIGNNIAEGFGRFNYQDNIRFCRIAKGSLYETLDHLIIALDEKYITKEKYDLFKEMFDHCLKILNGYVAYLKKVKELEKVK